MWLKGMDKKYNETYTKYKYKREEKEKNVIYDNK